MRHHHFQVSDLRTETAEGLAKLMYTGRISSAKMLSRLVLLWYNPVTEDDTRLRHCLGVFFQLYARESRSDMFSYSSKQCDMWLIYYSCVQYFP